MRMRLPVVSLPVVLTGQPLIIAFIAFQYGIYGVTNAEIAGSLQVDLCFLYCHHLLFFQ